MNEHLSAQAAEAEFYEWQRVENPIETAARYENSEGQLLARSRRENYTWYETLQLAEQAAGHPATAEAAWREVRGHEIFVNRLQTALVIVNPSRFVTLTEEGTEAKTEEIPAAPAVAVVPRGSNESLQHISPFRRAIDFLSRHAS